MTDARDRPVLEGGDDVEAFVHLIVRALKAADPDAFIMTPADGERTAISGSFDLFKVAQEIRTAVASSQ